MMFFSKRIVEIAKGKDRVWNVFVILLDQYLGVMPRLSLEGFKTLGAELSLCTFSAKDCKLT